MAKIENVFGLWDIAQQISIILQTFTQSQKKQPKLQQRACELSIIPKFALFLGLQSQNSYKIWDYRFGADLFLNLASKKGRADESTLPVSLKLIFFLTGQTRQDSVPYGETQEFAASSRSDKM